MLAIFKQLLDTEKELVFKERSKGKFVMRPSSVILTIVALLYLASPIDLIPEGLITPKICGFIDDLVLLIFTGYYVYLDIGGELNGHNGVQHGKVSKERKPVRQDSIPSVDKPIHEDADVPSTDTDLHATIPTEESISSTSGDTNVNNDGYDLDGYDFGNGYEDDDIFGNFKI